jgi:putative ABC transport system substrate-binding protein
MDRRTFVGDVAAGLLAVPLAALAQSRGVVKIGWLAFQPITSNLATFRQTLKEFGYVEGENLVIEQRYAGRVERYAEVTAELIRLKVDIIVTTGTLASLEAKKVTAAIPIVFVSSLPVARELVASLSSPGGNLTGMEITSGEFDAKRVQLLKDAVPGLVKLAMLNDTSGQLGSANQQRYWGQSEAAARQVGIQSVQRFDVHTIDEVDGAFATASKAGAGAMLTPSSSFFHANKDRLVNAAASSRLPTIYEHGDFVEAGGLMSYGPDLREVFRGAAVLVDKVLKGAKPATLPVEQVTKVVFVINQKTVKALALTIPQSLLSRADEVIR